MATLATRLTESWLGRMVRQAFTPARTLSLAFLTLGGFVAGVVFWGGFNTVLEATNTETFCTSCHEMKTNVFEELKGTIHYANRSGVRATCPDCHVPQTAAKPLVENRFTDMDALTEPERGRH